MNQPATRSLRERVSAEEWALRVDLAACYRLVARYGMTDLSLLAYNDEPGPLAREVAENPKGIDPLFIDLVERWPGRSRWFGN